MLLTKYDFKNKKVLKHYISAFVIKYTEICVDNNTALNLQFEGDDF